MNCKYSIEHVEGVPSEIKLFLETRYQSMYTTLSYFRELKRVEDLHTLLLYNNGELCEAFIYEIIGRECILLNRVTHIVKEPLLSFSQWIFNNLSKIQKISFWDLLSPFRARYSICYSRSLDIYVNLPSTSGEYDAMLGKKSRTQFKYYIKKAEREISDLKIDVNAEYDSFDSNIFEEIVSLKEKRFDSKKQQNSFNGLKACQHAQFAKDYGRITVVQSSNKIIASLLCYKVCDKYFASLVAFDIDYAKYSLGRTVFYLAIQRAIKERISEFHFLWGGSDYVTHYGGQEVPLYTAHVFRSYNVFYYMSLCNIKYQLMMKRLKQVSFFRRLIPYYHHFLYSFSKIFNGKINNYRNEK